MPLRDYKSNIVIFVYKDKNKVMKSINFIQIIYNIILISDNIYSKNIMGLLASNNGAMIRG